MSVEHETVTARATCSYCAWRAEHRGPALEVSDFLRRRIIDHLRERHPEAEQGGETVGIVDMLAADMLQDAATRKRPT